MPATHIYVVEKTPRLIARLRAVSSDQLWPVQLARCTNTNEAVSRISECYFPIAVLDAQLPDEEMLELVRCSNAAKGWAVAAGRLAVPTIKPLLYDAGLFCELPSSLTSEKWRALLDRLIRRSQEMFAVTG